jgi:hypothetical protein
MPDYRERLHIPLAWWLLAIPTVLILGGTLYAGLPWPWPIIIPGGLAAGCAALLITFGRGSVEVGDGALRAGSAVLPLTAVSEVVALDERQSAQLRGPRADPAAHLYLRPYLKESVYVAVDPAASAASSADPGVHGPHGPRGVSKAPGISEMPGGPGALRSSGVPAVSGVPRVSRVPYWLIGTRHPAELAAAIERCRVQAGHEPVA